MTKTKIEYLFSLVKGIVTDKADKINRVGFFSLLRTQLTERINVLDSMSGMGIVKD